MTAGESKPEAYIRKYGEDFDELRTKLEAVFNILLSPAVGDHARHPFRPILASVLRNRPGDQS